MGWFSTKQLKVIGSQWLAITRLCSLMLMVGARIAVLKQYFLIEDSYGIFIISRGACGMRVYKPIGNDIFSIIQCDIEFFDENR